MKWLRTASAANLLLVFVPIAIGLKFAHTPDLWVFVASAAAIVPLAGLMGRTTETLADRLGPALGSLLNASFGNAAELIIALVALRAGLVDIVKASITGSILGNLLLVLGASFLAGGLKHHRQTFNPTAASVSATLLALSAVGLLVPAIFHAHLQFHHEAGHEQSVSMEIAGVLLACYALMLVFSLKTHKHLYLGGWEEGGEEPASADEFHSADSRTSEPRPSVVRNLTLLLASTAVLALMSELLVGTIAEASKQLGWSELFVGVIVVAIVGNAAEHWTAVAVAVKNQVELSVQIAIGSGLQIALFVAPLLVFVSRLPGFAPMDLVFTTLEVVSVAISVVLVGLVANDGESTWIEGLLLIAVYLVLGIAFFHLPESLRTPLIAPAP